MINRPRRVKDANRGFRQVQVGKVSMVRKVKPSSSTLARTIQPRID
jgi:hypothetical protein